MVFTPEIFTAPFYLTSKRQSQKLRNRLLISNNLY
ncbi:hypothetical protein J2Z37_001064 [Ammoniphilus resinae]|uniref:Uncharacterized protein n=1 Tax=Ammoniphilus resinae TaxID=861532 RepID=A0ABS4GLF0_9BACL|nr:hypothetical protein [Ammoniphilus resinae]